MIKFIILLISVLIVHNSNAQTTLVNENFGKRGVVILSGFSLSTISYSVNLEQGYKPQKDIIRIIPFSFGVSLIIGGVLPDKNKRFYRNKNEKTELPN